MDKTVLIFKRLVLIELTPPSNCEGFEDGANDKAVTL